MVRELIEIQGEAPMKFVTGMLVGGILVFVEYILPRPVTAPIIDDGWDYSSPSL